MWDFDGDEFAFMVAAAIVGVMLAARSSFCLFSVWPKSRGIICRMFLAIVPPVCMAIVLIVLMNWSDEKTVRGHPDYITLFLAGACAWIWGTIPFAGLLGISYRDDAVERHNPAAGIAILGAMLGQTFCYSGSNIGQGPTIWTTIVPAIFASGAMFICWLSIEAFTRVSETITIERHVPSAIILAAHLLSAGLIFGWASSGDWHSWEETYADFLNRAWIGALLAIPAIILLHWRKPRPAASSTAISMPGRKLQ